MSCVNIRGCRIGEGRPKVILPIVEHTEAAILEKAAQFSTLPADCVEWRADWFESFQSPAAIARCVQKLRVALRDKLLLVTFRTKAEGGEQALSHSEYLTSSEPDPRYRLRRPAGHRVLHRRGRPARTGGAGTFRRDNSGMFQPRLLPRLRPAAELVSRMVQMQQAGADLPKLAVMPQCRTDVLELLAATAEMADLHPETPVITMSMGALGAVSRLAGETFGSAMTFANPGQASAPGQVSLNIVNEVLDALHL